MSPMQSALLRKVRWRPWEFVVWVVAFALPVITPSHSLMVNEIAIVALFAIPTFGWLSDRVGRKTMFFASCAFNALFAFPFFWLVDTRDPTIVIFAIVAAITFGQMMMFGIGAPWYSELFSARLRYSGASLGFQVGAALSGGLSPKVFRRCDRGGLG